MQRLMSLFLPTHIWHSLCYISGLCKLENFATGIWCMGAGMLLKSSCAQPSPPQQTIYLGVVSAALLMKSCGQTFRQPLMEFSQIYFDGRTGLLQGFPETELDGNSRFQFHLPWDFAAVHEAPRVSPATAVPGSCFVVHLLSLHPAFMFQIFRH